MTYRVIARLKGGEGSGHRGHAGRPGKRGGSLPGKGSSASVITSPRKGGMTANTDDFTDDEGCAKLLSEYASKYIGRDAYWRHVSREERGMVKHALITELAEKSGLEYDEVNKMVKQWARSSNDQDMRSLSLQQAASEELGLPLSDWQKGRIEWTLANRSGDNVTSLYPREKERRFIRAVYDHTQEVLANAGYGPDDMVRVYRGTSEAKENVVGTPVFGRTYKYHGNAMESWTIGAARATPYGPYVFSANVPRRNILACAISGQGSLTEGEFLIAGSMGGEAYLMGEGG